MQFLTLAFQVALNFLQNVLLGIESRIPIYQWKLQVGTNEDDPLVLCEFLEIGRDDEKIKPYFWKTEIKWHY